MAAFVLPLITNVVIPLLTSEQGKKVIEKIFVHHPHLRQETNPMNNPSPMTAAQAVYAQYQSGLAMPVLPQTQPQPVAQTEPQPVAQTVSAPAPVQPVETPASVAVAPPVEAPSMNWLSVLSNVWKLAPYIVAGIETIHANESTETKTQLAQDALGIALGGSAQVLSSTNEASAQVVAGAVSQAISLSQNLITSLKTPPVTK